MEINTAWLCQLVVDRITQDAMGGVAVGDRWYFRCGGEKKLAIVMSVLNTGGARPCFFRS